jgi:hypothetical protein
MIKLLYKPVDLIASMVGGLLAGLIFKRVWKVIGRGDAPEVKMASIVWPGRRVKSRPACRLRSGR